jgi:hypothetical protein
LKTLILYFFTETHLDNSISDADISLPGFEVPIRRDRNCSGGGIIFYYKGFVNVIRRQDLEHGDLLECMWFELKTKFQSILININYRSVRQAPAYYWQYFDFMLKRALDENCNIICLGDLNLQILEILFSSMVLLTLLINRHILIIAQVIILYLIRG